MFDSVPLRGNILCSAIPACWLKSAPKDINGMPVAKTRVASFNAVFENHLYTMYRLKQESKGKGGMIKSLHEP